MLTSILPRNTIRIKLVLKVSLVFIREYLSKPFKQRRTLGAKQTLKAKDSLTLVRLVDPSLTKIKLVLQKSTIKECSE